MFNFGTHTPWCVCIHMCVYICVCVCILFKNKLEFSLPPFRTTGCKFERSAVEEDIILCGKKGIE